MKTLPHPDENPAACAGQSALFDSRLREDHQQARALCDTCPVFAACWDHLQAVKRAPKHLGGSPEGTWAGQLFGEQSESAARRNKGEGYAVEGRASAVAS